MVTFEGWLDQQKHRQDDVGQAARGNAECRKQARKEYLRIYPSVDSEVVDKLREVRPDHDDKTLQAFLDSNF